jgi:hypothetical protein
VSVLFSECDALFSYSMYCSQDFMNTLLLGLSIETKLKIFKSNVNISSSECSGMYCRVLN